MSDYFENIYMAYVDVLTRQYAVGLLKPDGMVVFPGQSLRDARLRSNRVLRYRLRDGLPTKQRIESMRKRYEVWKGEKALHTILPDVPLVALA